MNQQSNLLHEPKEIHETFQECFPQLFGEKWWTGGQEDLTNFLAELPCLSGQEVDGCEGLITAVEVEKTVAGPNRWD